MRKFVNLGYTLQRNGGQEAHMRDRIKKTATVMRQVWEIRKRRFGKDFDGYGIRGNNLEIERVERYRKKWRRGI